MTRRKDRHQPHDYVESLKPPIDMKFSKSNTSCPQVKLAEEKPDDKAESSPVTRRSNRVSQHAKDNRHTMPPNMYSPKQISSERNEAPKPAENKTAAASAQAASGRDKMRTALGGMMAAIEAEKQHKGM